ncbi:benenodin family lasso peptide [Novosphingobium sp. BL-8H]
MERGNDTIDLGTASVETKGPYGVNGDLVLAQTVEGTLED